MPYRLTFRQDARTEFRAAARWYERQRPGLGSRFTAAVEAVLSQIVVTPDRYTVCYREVRRALVARFPYAVFFRVDGNKVRVISVFHTRRDPAVWQARAEEEAD
jgi:plasmid stabilization system protein ParE